MAGNRATGDEGITGKVPVGNEIWAGRAGAGILGDVAVLHRRDRRRQVDGDLRDRAAAGAGAVVKAHRDIARRRAAVRGRERDRLDRGLVIRARCQAGQGDTLSVCVDDGRDASGSAPTASLSPACAFMIERPALCTLASSLSMIDTFGLVTRTAEPPAVARVTELVPAAVLSRSSNGPSLTLLMLNEAVAVSVRPALSRIV